MDVLLYLDPSLQISLIFLNKNKYSSEYNKKSKDVEKNRFSKRKIRDLHIFAQVFLTAEDNQEFGGGWANFFLEVRNSMMSNEN